MKAPTSVEVTVTFRDEDGHPVAQAGNRAALDERGRTWAGVLYALVMRVEHKRWMKAAGLPLAEDYELGTLTTLDGRAEP